MTDKLTFSFSDYSYRIVVLDLLEEELLLAKGECVSKRPPQDLFLRLTDYLPEEIYSIASEKELDRIKCQCLTYDKENKLVDIFNIPLTITKINNEHNAELKRCYMEIYGFDKLLDEVDAKPLKEDNYGKIYKLPNSQLPIVRVTNSSPEPDGSYKDYVLTSLHENVKTPHAAVASTFGLTTDTYNPAIQT